MDREIVEQKLDSLRRCVQRIESRCPQSAEALANDFDLQDIVSLNLSRAVQLCVDIGAHLITGLDAPAPDTMGQTFDILAHGNLIPAELASNLKKAVGFRNIAVHNYDAINWAMVHSIATQHLADFSAFARAVAEQLNKP